MCERSTELQRAIPSLFLAARSFPSGPAWFKNCQREMLRSKTGRGDLGGSPLFYQLANWGTSARQVELGGAFYSGGSKPLNCPRSVPLSKFPQAGFPHPCLDQLSGVSPPLALPKALWQAEVHPVKLSPIAGANCLFAPLMAWQGGGRGSSSPSAPAQSFPAGRRSPGKAPPTAKSYS